MTEGADVSTEYVLQNLKEVVMRCLQQKPVMTYDPEVRGMVQAVDADGNGVWQFDSMGANKALELLGKYKAMWTDRLKVDEGSALTLLREKLNADPK